MAVSCFLASTAAIVPFRNLARMDLKLELIGSQNCSATRQREDR